MDGQLARKGPIVMSRTEVSPDTGSCQPLTMDQAATAARIRELAASVSWPGTVKVAMFAGRLADDFAASTPDFDRARFLAGCGYLQAVREDEHDGSHTDGS
jgi:hypothetical protein